MLTARLSFVATICGLLGSMFVASSAHALDPLPAGPVVTVTETTSTIIRLAWTQEGDVPGFLVSYSTSANFDAESTKTTSTLSVSLSGLAKQTSYYVRVKGVDADGNDLTDWSATVKATTGPILVRIGSFNVKDPDSKADGSCRLWGSGRKELVAQEIVDSKADVIGTQETYEDDERAGLLRSIRAKGGTYAMTRPESEQSGWDNRLLYNPSRVRLVASKAVPFKHQDGDGRSREYVRGTFELLANHHQFLVYTTHVEPGGSATLKAQQWEEIRSNAVANGVKKKLPVFVVGDYNTSKFRAPANTMLPKMKSAGFGDVLGQTYQSYKVSGQRAKTRTDAWINSYNDCNPRYGKVAKSAIGNNIDWIFATNSLEIPAWRTVVHFNSGNSSLAKTPMASDHFMVTIQARLP